MQGVAHKLRLQSKRGLASLANGLISRRSRETQRSTTTTTPTTTTIIAGVQQQGKVKCKMLSERQNPRCLVKSSALLHAVQVSQRFLEEEGRHNYTTPKSFLELIDFYKELMRTKRAELGCNIARLANGLKTLRKTNDDVQV